MKEDENLNKENDESRLGTRRRFLGGFAAFGAAPSMFLLGGCESNSCCEKSGNNPSKIGFRTPGRRIPPGTFPKLKLGETRKKNVAKKLIWDFDRLLQEVETLAKQTDGKRKALNFINSDQSVRLLTSPFGSRPLGVMFVHSDFHVKRGKVLGVRIKGCMLRGHKVAPRTGEKGFDEIENRVTDCDDAETRSKLESFSKKHQPPGHKHPSLRKRKRHDHLVYSSSSSSWPIPG